MKYAFYHKVTSQIAGLPQVSWAHQTIRKVKLWIPGFIIGRQDHPTLKATENILTQNQITWKKTFLTLWALKAEWKCMQNTKNVQKQQRKRPFKQQ